MAYRVLIANENLSDRTRLSELLTSAGYDATAAPSFEDARLLVGAHPPDLLIAQLRLGAFNGLHLVLRGRAERPDMSAIITTGPEDHMIKSEATDFGVLCVPTPLAGDTHFLAVVAKAIEGRGSPVWH